MTGVATVTREKDVSGGWIPSHLNSHKPIALFHNENAEEEMAYVVLTSIHTSESPLHLRSTRKISDQMSEITRVNKSNK